MRHDFVKQVLIEMEKNKNVFFLTADLGFNALEPIQKAFPDRFINVGIAEANMIGIASGLAHAGRTVIAYSIASFISLRPFEQIKMDVCYDNLNVKLFGAGGGFNYPTHGISHHATEDITIMRSLPHMKVLCPAYSWEAREATKAALQVKGPTYMRLSKSPGIDFSKPNWKFKIGKGFEVREGKDIVLISTGNILENTVATAKKVEKVLGRKVAVISMPTVKPLDHELILKKVGARMICTLEEHSVLGGLGGAVSEALMQSPIRPTIFIPFGIQDKLIKDVGSREYLLKKAGLGPDEVSKKIITEYRRFYKS